MKSWEEFVKKILKFGCLALILYALLIFAASTGVYALLCVALGWKFRWWVAILIYILWCWVLKTA